MSAVECSGRHSLVVLIGVLVVVRFITVFYFLIVFQLLWHFPSWIFYWSCASCSFSFSVVVGRMTVMHGWTSWLNIYFGCKCLFLVSCAILINYCTYTCQHYIYTIKYFLINYFNTQHESPCLDIKVSFRVTSWDLNYEFFCNVSNNVMKNKQ